MEVISNEIIVIMHIISETFSTVADFIGDVLMQVGLAFIIIYGYLRHWVSEIFQCHFFFESLFMRELFTHKIFGSNKMSINN